MKAETCTKEPFDATDPGGGKATTLLLSLL